MNAAFQTLKVNRLCIFVSDFHIIYCKLYEYYESNYYFTCVILYNIVVYIILHHTIFIYSTTKVIQER